VSCSVVSSSRSRAAGVSRELLCRVFVPQPSRQVPTLFTSRRRSVSWLSPAGAPPRCISFAVFVYSGARVRGSAALSLKRAADRVLAFPCDRAAVGLDLRFPVARRRFSDFTPALGIVRLILPPQASPAWSRFCQLACSSTGARLQQQPLSGVSSPEPALGVHAAVCRSSPSRPRLPSRRR
jgi:hypothetical protein